MSDKTKQREIKFRAWDGEKMTQSNIAIWLHGDVDIFDTNDNGNQEPFRRFDGALMQFTGLHDKNGKEIYEGDICWTYEHGVGNLLRVVEFKDGSFVFAHPYALTIELRGWKTDYMEVKGNIYQNPELLQK